MNNEERDAVLESLADTLVKTRAELDALRIVTQAMLQALTAKGDLEPLLVAALHNCINADTAISLGSQMSDPLLADRTNWLKRLIPAPIAQKLQLP